MITIGRVSRQTATEWFEFLGEGYRGRPTAIRDLTHGVPEFVFWIYPDGRLHDAKTSHRAHPPPGYEYIVKDEPGYGGFLRGRVVRHAGRQLVAVYCREDAMAVPGQPLNQLLDGLSQMPMPMDEDALVISDNADIYGTLQDLWDRRYAMSVEEGES